MYSYNKIKIEDPDCKFATIEAYERIVEKPDGNNRKNSKTQLT